MSLNFSKCLLIVAISIFSVQIIFSQDYVGALDTELVANTDDLEDVFFREVRNVSRLNFEVPPDSTAHITSAKLYHPQQDKNSIISALVEEENENPIMYVDLNMEVSRNLRVLR
jgi:hypothetical protein